MAFDINTAVPVMAGGFDMSTAVPVNDQLDSGFFSDIGKAYDKRINNSQSVANDVVNNNISSASGILQGAGQAAGFAFNDIPSEVVKTAAEGANSYMKMMHPDAQEAISKAAENTAKSPAGKFTGDQIKNIASMYQAVKQAHPEAVGNIEAAANLGMAFPAIKSGVGMIGDVGGDVANSAVNFAKDPLASIDASAIKKATPEIPLNTASQDKSVASSWYDKVDKSGETISNNTSQKLSSSLDALKPQDPGEAAVWDKSGIQKHVDIIKDAMKQGPLTFRGAQALRADLNSELKVAYRAGDDTKAMQLEKIKASLTDSMKGPEKSSYAWQMANHEFAKGGAKEDLELLVSKAEGKAQPANSLDTAINNLLNNKNASAGLRLNEKNALKDVVKKTNQSELLKSAGTRLLSTAGASVGGVPGFLIGHYGSTFARDAAMTAKLKKLDKVYELISNRTPPSPRGPWGATKGK